MRATITALALAVGLATAASGAALADDRKPTVEERARIEAAVRAAGFVTWEEIEFDDGLWEVDDAKDSTGQEYDLKIDPTSFAIVSRRRDD